MILFLLKGLIRDRSRSLFPLLTVIGGVSCTVVLYSYMTGIQNEMIWAHASLNSGHVRIMSRAYAEEMDQLANDLALTGVNDLLEKLQGQYPHMIWAPRIKFGAILDIPDKNRETRFQSPIIGLALDLLYSASEEVDILNLDKALIQGNFPEKKQDMLISDLFARQLGAQIGDTVTLIGKTMHGSISTMNFQLTGTVHFGISYLDRGAILADLADIQIMMDMEDTAGEIFGFCPNFMYQEEETSRIATEFNARHKSEEEFSPIMFTFSDQYGQGEILRTARYFSGVIILIFLIIKSIVLWNAGLMGSLRRYGEIGVRLAIGENKGHLYRSLLVESLMIGISGSFVGTALGLAFSHYLQTRGIDISSMTQNASMLIVDVLRAQVTQTSYFIGFIPGVCATFLGTTISGIGIYRRKTSTLFKELEE